MDDSNHAESGDAGNELFTDQGNGYEAANEAEPGTDTDVQRRSFLKMTGVATSAVAASGLVGSAAAATTRHGISFDRVVDAVDDLGMDNTGSSPIDDALDNALQSGTLVEFPPGTYLVTRQHSIANMDRVGIRGTGDSRRDAKLVPPQGADVRVLASGSAGSGAVLVENLSFDDRSDNSTITSLFIRTTGNTVVKNVEWLGRTPRVGQGSGTDFQFGAEVTSQGGVMVCEDVYAGLDEPAVEVDYPNGVMFFWGGPSHSGELVLRNPVIQERNSAATRFTNCSGVVTIEGGEFVNNQNANIRFTAGTHPSKVSSVDGTYVEVDGSRSSGEAVRCETSNGAHSGSVFENMEIKWTKHSGRGVFAVPSYQNHGSFTVRNCTVRNDGGNTETINARQGSEPVTVEGCTFIGTGTGFDASGRTGSIIRDSCIDMPNASITGFDTENVSSSCDSNADPSPSIEVSKKSDETVDLTAAGSADEDGEIVAYDWDVDGTAYTGETVSHTFPDAGTYTVSLTVEDNEGATATATTGVTVGYDNSLKIQGKGQTTNYEFEVSGSVVGDGETVEQWDEVNESSANGWVTETSDVDEFAFEGEITSFVFHEGEADVYVNGEKVDPTGSADSAANHLKIQGKGETTEYAFEVSGSLEGANDSIEQWDDVSGSSANGWVTETSDVDEFTFEGEITAFEFPQGDANVYVNGEKVDPTGSADSSADSESSTDSGSSTKNLKIQGKGQSTNYEFEVSGSVEGANDSIEQWDDVSGSSANGWVTETKHVDEFTVEGEITSFVFHEGEADVYVDGEKVDHTAF